MISSSQSSPVWLAASAFLLTPGLLLADFKFQDTPNDHLDILHNGKTVVRYQYTYDKSSPERLAETYKPILHVFKPDGSGPITKGAGGDFTHHRGWFIGWAKISVNGEKIDRWHMKGGSIIHQKFLSQTADAKSATFKAQLAWEGTTSAPVILEERTITVTEGPAPAYVQLEMHTELKSQAGEVVLDGDPEHAGFQFRPAQQVNKAKTSYLFPKADADPHKDLDYAWAAENFELDGKSYHVAFLNHPQNPTETRFSAYRDYGRFGAFFKGTIPANGSFQLKARLLVSEETPLTAEFIQKAANAFTGKSDPTPAFTERSADKPAPKKAPEPKKDADPAKATQPATPAGSK
jgi:hypothetical protein